MATSILHGWSAVEKLKAEADQRKRDFEEGKFRKKRHFSIIVKENSDKYPEDVDITFVDEEPTILPLVTFQSSQGWTTRRYRGKNDPIHKMKDVKPKMTCLFTVVDHSERTYINKDGEEVTVKDQIKYLALSVSQAQQLKSYPTRLKKNLSDMVFNVSKAGGRMSFLPVDRDPEFHTLPEDVYSIDFEEEFPLENAEEELRF